LSKVVERIHVDLNKHASPVDDMSDIRSVADTMPTSLPRCFDTSTRAAVILLDRAHHNLSFHPSLQPVCSQTKRPSSRHRYLPVFSKNAALHRGALSAIARVRRKGVPRASTLLIALLFHDECILFNASS
jgi:hypothetical protein